MFRFIFRFVIFLVLVVFLSIQLDWVVVTPKAYKDFRKIKAFFSELMSSNELEKVKSLNRSQDITDLAKQENLQLYRKSGKKLTEKVVNTTEAAGKIRHHIEETGFWSDIKTIYQGFFSNQ